MTDPRAALEKLTVALERHFEAANSSRDPDHPMVVAAAQDLAEAFDTYDEALFEATEVATPLAIYGEEFDVEDDEGGPYAGLESDDYEDDEDDEDDDEDDDELDEFEDDDEFEDEDDEQEGAPAR